MNISVTPVTLVLSVGASAQLAATVRSLDGALLSGRDVQWSSSAPAVAEVSGSGVATAIAPGTANVGAYSAPPVPPAKVACGLTSDATAGNLPVQPRLPSRPGASHLHRRGRCRGREGRRRLPSAADRGHLRVTVRRKMMVTQGDVLGSMGAWGDEEYPWMHFELRLNNQDPGDIRVLDNLLLEGRRFADYRVSE